MTEEELKVMIDEIEDEGVLETQESNLVRSALEFDEITVDEIITPRVRITAVEAGENIDDVRKKFLQEEYSRMPVYERTLDNIIGIITEKEFFKQYEKSSDFTIRSIMQETIYLPQMQKLSEVFRTMQKQKCHMSVVLDQHGGTLGIVTMEDILEEIVGDILDEYDEDEITIRAQKDNSLIIDGLAYLEDVEEELDADFGDTEFETLNGYLTNILGHIPTDKDIDTTIKAIGYCFTILSIGNKTIGKVRVERDK